MINIGSHVLPVCRLFLTKERISACLRTGYHCMQPRFLELFPGFQEGSMGLSQKERCDWKNILNNYYRLYTHVYSTHDLLIYTVYIYCCRYYMHYTYKYIHIYIYTHIYVYVQIRT